MWEYAADQDQEYVQLPIFQPPPPLTILTLLSRADKETWINRERLRWARHFSIPITVPLPPDFPAPSLPVMRALAAIGTAESESDNSNGQPRLIKALDALFSQHWEHAVATHKPEVLKESLAGLFGAEEAEKSEFLTYLLRTYLPKHLSLGASTVSCSAVLRPCICVESGPPCPAVVVHSTASHPAYTSQLHPFPPPLPHPNNTNKTPQTVLTAASTTGKAALIQNTDAAFDSGGFGLPWMVCTNAEGQTEGFFGVDHLGQVAQFLGLGRGENKGGWRALL